MTFPYYVCNYFLGNGDSHNKKSRKLISESKCVIKKKICHQRLKNQKLMEKSIFQKNPILFKTGCPNKRNYTCHAPLPPFRSAPPMSDRINNTKQNILQAALTTILLLLVIHFSNFSANVFKPTPHSTNHDIYHNQPNK